MPKPVIPATRHRPRHRRELGRSVSAVGVVDGERGREEHAGPERFGASRVGRVVAGRPRTDLDVERAVGPEERHGAPGARRGARDGARA